MKRTREVGFDGDPSLATQYGIQSELLSGRATKRRHGKELQAAVQREKLRSKQDKNKQAGKAAPVLPWMRVPVALQGTSAISLQHVQGMQTSLVAALSQGGYTSLFPVQAAYGQGLRVVCVGGYTSLFPVQAAVWQQTAGGLLREHDLVLSAPTGSGKTLAYALPLLNSLARHTGSGLAALVVLPTKDLAQQALVFAHGLVVQVYGVFQQLCPAVGLSVGLVNGRATEAEEAATIMRRDPMGPAGALHEGPPLTQMHRCAVRVLIATPGRLMAHIDRACGLTLESVQFLVIDEIDRLMRQSYQQWLPRVTALLPDRTGARRVMKILASATITSDPAKLGKIQLHSPRYIAASATDYRYTLPKSLQEFKALGSSEEKGLVLLALLHTMVGEKTVIFTASVDATHRVCLLLNSTDGSLGRAAEYSSSLPVTQRSAALSAFKSGKITLLVCSDALTRGMDIEDVTNVINYDAPVYVKTYVHRAGRTARAGKTGRVVTILRDEDMKHFKDMLHKVDNNYVREWKHAKGLLESLRPTFTEALQQMQVKLAQEQQARHQPLDTHQKLQPGVDEIIAQHVLQCLT